MATMLINHSNQNLPQSFKKESHILLGSWYMSYSHCKQRFLEGIKCLKDNVNVDQFVNYLLREEKIIEVCSSNRCDNALCYKTLPNPLAQSGQSASENYRTVQKFEGIFFKNTIYAAWI